MKYLAFFFMTAFITSTFASDKILAKTVVKKSKGSFVAQKYKDVLCKQKYIPMKMEQSLDAHLLKVTFTPLEKMDAFSITNVRGLKGVTVKSFLEIKDQSLEIGDKIEATVELSDFTGLVYVVFDVSTTINGKVLGHSIPVPVGSLSQAQRFERSKSIREALGNPRSSKGVMSSPLSTPPVKYHEMQLEENK